MKENIKKGFIFLLILSTLLLKGETKKEEYSPESKKETSITEVDTNSVSVQTNDLPQEETKEYMDENKIMHIYGRYYEGSEQIKMNVPSNTMEMYRYYNKCNENNEVEQLRLYASFSNLSQEEIKKEGLTSLGDAYFPFYFVQGTKEVKYNVEGTEGVTKEGYVFVTDTLEEGYPVICPVYDMDNDPLYVVEDTSTKEIYVASKNDIANNPNLKNLGFASKDLVDHYNTGVYIPYITEAISNPQILNICSDYYEASNTNNDDYVRVLK